MRVLLALVLALAFPLTAGALDLAGDNGSRVLIDADCTDDYDTPATTVGDITTVTTWDEPSEVIDPDDNLFDSRQTSGSSDGWCDDEPWVIYGVITTGTNETLFIGPVTYPRRYSGFYYSWIMSVIGTSYSFDWMLVPPYVSNPANSDLDVLGQIGDTSGTAQNMYWVGQLFDEGTDQIAGHSFWPWPEGSATLLRLDLNGAASWDLKFATVMGRGIAVELE